MRRRPVAASLALLAVLGCSSRPQAETQNPILAEMVDYRNGLAMLREGRVDEAVSLLMRARANDPKSPAIVNALGLALLYKKDYTGALKCFNEALKLEPNFVESLNNRGVCLMEMGKLNEAEGDFVAVLGSASPSEKQNGHYNLGVLHEKRGRLAEAEKEFSTVVAEDPKSRRGMKERGLVRAKREDFRGALEDFLAILKEEPKDSVANFQAALCLLTTGRRDLAVRYMERTVLAAPDSDEGQRAKRFLESERRVPSAEGVQ